MIFRLIICLVAACAAIASGAGAGERPSKSVRIAMLLSGTEASSAYLKSFYQGLAEQGLVEGKNLTLDRHYANGQVDRMPAIAAEIVASGADLIFTSGDPAAKAAKAATDRIPIVAVTCDALAGGLVTNLSRPGGNLTGVTCINADLDGKRVEIIKEILPSIAKLGIVLNPDDKRSQAELKEVELAAKASAIELLTKGVTRPDELGPAFSQAADAGASGIIVIYDPSFFVRRRELAEAASGRHIATVFNFREFVEAGGLISYGPNVQDMCRQSTRLIRKVLDGERAGEIPMEQPTRFELVVNLKTARTIGLTIPPSLLGRADDVFE